MAKLERGKIVGHRTGMDSFNSEELIAWAERMDGRADVVKSGAVSPEGRDDPKWLQRRAMMLLWLAKKKEKAAVHKEGQRKRRMRVQKSD